ncbi:hypothetical protein [Cytophaga sp. FL35]|uniref:hypothetical protein n=1 Tax=Cytophaga sp. FL35 TaxID=1904456 RepID=UPI001653E636|nr:hypothetical protein [Cytophaga sp. FL35]MBC6998173.1 hypothetical protein [Cytophaga sp. FL35]
MKNALKKIAFGLLCLSFFSVNLIQASSEQSKYSDIEFRNPLIADGLVGIWKYTVVSAPLEYSSGVIVISQKDKDYGVEVELSGATLKGYNVQVVGAKITFDVNVEGTVFSVALTAEGDSISGESSSYDGTYQITGSRITPK